MLRLYDYPASANCYKARLLLAQLGLPYERVAVDIFAGESTTAEHLARNPAGRTPVLELDSGETIAESNAILLYLGEGTPFVPDALAERARVWQWLFFEQNLFEPNVGTARFWRLTGRDSLKPEVFEARLDSARAGLETLDRGSQGSASCSARRTRSPTSRSTRTRTWQGMPGSTWRPTAKSRPGCAAWRRHRAS